MKNKNRGGGDTNKKNVQNFLLAGIHCIGRFALLYNCVVEIHTHFNNTLKYELTTCLKSKLCKLHVVVLFCCQNHKKLY